MDAAIDDPVETGDEAEADGSRREADSERVAQIQAESVSFYWQDGRRAGGGVFHEDGQTPLPSIHAS